MSISRGSSGIERVHNNSDVGGPVPGHNAVAAATLDAVQTRSLQPPRGSVAGLLRDIRAAAGGCDGWADSSTFAGQDEKWIGWYFFFE